MTIHSAKGLEFGIVFVVGVEDEIIPSAKSLQRAEDIEEERRLMYVAITRAKRYCMVSYAKKRTLNGKTVQTFPSRFLRDIHPRYLRMMTGSSLDGPTASRRETTTFTETSIPPTPTLRQAAVNAPKPRAAAPVSAGGHTTHSAADLQEGQRIEHPNFGLGIIREIDTSRTDDRIVVEFSADGTRRTLLLKFARFKILS